MSNSNNSNQNCGGNNIYVSGAETRTVIEVSNNKSKYYAELAETYKNKAKEYCDSARYYAEQNSDVSMNYIDTLEATLRNLISTKQDAGNYALSSSIPTVTSDLTNDSGYITNSALSGYQTDLVSGTSIKTLNNNSLLGSGNIDISVRIIGEIVTSTMPLTDVGLHILDGTLLAYGSYSAFIDYIADLYDSGDYTAIFDTEANWQAAVTTNGVCDKFVYNSVNNTVRLPKYGSQIFTKSASGTVPVIGNGKTLGLTNGTDSGALITNSGGAWVDSTGIGDVSTSTSHGTLINGHFGVTTDSTKSGMVADLSNITNYPLDCYYYIVVATTTKTSIQVDIDEIATDLNGKADVDLSNASPTSAFGTAMNTAGIRTVVYETTSNGCEIRVWSDGFKEIFCKQISNASAAAVDIYYPTNSTQYAFTAEPVLIVNQYQSSSATTSVTARGEGYARSATGFSVYFLAANASISYYACGY